MTCDLPRTYDWAGLRLLRGLAPRVSSRSRPSHLRRSICRTRRGDKPMSSPAAAAASIIYVGMDVHKDSITIAVLPMAARNPTRLDRHPNDLPKLKRYLGP